MLLFLSAHAAYAQLLLHAPTAAYAVGVTVNNASDYWANGLLTLTLTNHHNPNLSPLARYSDALLSVTDAVVLSGGCC